MRCVGCSWSRPTGASRISFGGHLSSGFHRSHLSSSSLSFPSSGDASFLVSCSSTSEPSDHKDSSNRSYSRRWYNPLPRRRHADQMPTSRIARDWIDSDTSTVSEDSERFTVVSYNILGDRNSSYHKDLYSNVSFPYLKWGYRKRLICEELIRLRPDIICMQEVDKYFDLFSMMEKAGYAGSYKVCLYCLLYTISMRFTFVEGGMRSKNIDGWLRLPFYASEASAKNLFL